jgi:trk system potassium uptake protein TrkA
MRVLVAGYGVWGAWIADHLAGQGHEVVVVEQEPAAAERARAAGDGSRTVIRGDACEPSVLERAVPERVATVVAATGDDEDNLVISLLAKRMFGVPRVVARVNNPKNTWLFDATWGVDTAVSAPAVLTHLLDSAIGVQEVVAMLRTGTHGVAVVEITLDDASPAVGRRPAELTLPEGAVVVAVVRADDVLVAGGSGPLAAGDELLAVTTLDAEPALRRALGGQPGGTHGPVT